MCICICIYTYMERADWEDQPLKPSARFRRGIATGKNILPSLSVHEHRVLMLRGLVLGWSERAEQILFGAEATVPWVQYSLLEGGRMMHAEALQWLNCIFAGRVRANCQQFYELGNATNGVQSWTRHKLATQVKQCWNLKRSPRARTCKWKFWLVANEIWRTT